MAIALDATATSNFASVSSVSFSHTCSGADRYLNVNAHYFDGGSAADRVSGITYNSVALTRITGQSSGGISVEMWRLIAPATGANTVVVTFTQTVDEGSIGSASYTGVHQTTPEDTAAGASGFSTTISVAAASASGDLVIDAAAQNDRTWTVGAGQTSTYTTTPAGERGASSREAGAASVTMSWSLGGGGSVTWVTSAYSLNPADAVTATLKDVMGYGGVVPFARA